MDENVQQNSDDIFSQTWTNVTTGQFSNNHSGGSSVWEILENAVNSIENSDASITSDRDGFRSHSDDLSDFITREPRFSSAFDITNYQMVNVPQGQDESVNITECFGNDRSVATIESERQEFSNFEENPNSPISDLSAGKFSEVTLPSNLLARELQMEKTIGGTQVDHYPIQQACDVMGVELPEDKELLMLLNEVACSAMSDSDLSTNYMSPVANGHLEDLGNNVSFSSSVIQQEDQQVLCS